MSRELRRNATTRSGKMEYQASVAQWKAETAAKRPKTAKLVTDPRLPVTGGVASVWLMTVAWRLVRP